MTFASARDFGGLDTGAINAARGKRRQMPIRTA